MMRTPLLFATCLLLSVLTGNARSTDAPSHGLASHGEPALGANYTHFPYANPDAPKGGKITYGVVGTYDNLNPFILKSMRTTARGMWDPEFGHLTYEALMRRSRDEPFTLYGLLAETIEIDDKRTYITFNLNPNARWSDGKPVTADDIVFTFEILQDKGRPPYSNRMKRITKMEKLNDLSVRFDLTADAGHEFPLILGLMPVLPKHATDVENFDKSTFEPPVTSGPYRIKSFKPGERITYERRDDYWAQDLPVAKGFHNFDEVTVEYFLSDSAQFEAFKKGVFDIFPDGNPITWERSYDFPAVERGDVIKAIFEQQIPAGMYGFVFNTRREMFQDVNLRKGLALLFDFEWVNRNLFNDAYKRTESYFQHSDLSSIGKPASEIELKLLEPYPNAVAPDVLDGTYRVPETDGTGRDRQLQRVALKLFNEAGYSIQNGKLVDKDKKALTFEVMTQNQGQEKVALAYQRNLAALGIDLSVRTVDDAQYQQRSLDFDYDMIVKKYPVSLSPGSEQVGRWGSESREEPGSFNYAGTADPAIDAMIKAMLDARSKEDFVASVRAFDRVLISGHYVVPLYYLPGQRAAYWSRLAFPERTSIYGYQLPTWWDKTAE